MFSQTFPPVGLLCCSPWEHQSLATVTIPDIAFLLRKEASNQKKFGYSNKLLQGLQHFLYLILLSQLFSWFSGVECWLKFWVNLERTAALIVHMWFSETTGICSVLVQVGLLLSYSSVRMLEWFVVNVSGWEFCGTWKWSCCALSPPRAKFDPVWTSKGILDIRRNFFT